MGYAPGALVVVRDEEWLVRSAMETSTSGTRLDVTGASGLVRDRDATFYTGIEPPGSVIPLDPKDTRLVADDTPGFRRSRLWLEALLKRSPAPVTDTRILVGHQALLDRMDYQYRPAERAMQNLRPRLLIGDAVGLGKTLEIGVILSELARRGRAERVLVVTPRAVLEQFQHEMWTRFAFPLVRLDSEGIQRIRRELPASRNPFSYYRRVICSIDTLKNPARYKHHLENHRWDVVVIDECHSLINRATLNNQLAELLARQTDALILASATPHNGKPESFAELVRLLDPTAITDPSSYGAKDIEHLYVRRHRNSKDVAVDVADRWKARAEPRVVAVKPNAAEEAVLRELQSVWLRPAGGQAPTSGRGRTLFPWTLFKAFLSSPVALRSTIRRRVQNLSANASADAGREIDALQRLDGLAATADSEDSAKLTALLDRLRDIGVSKAGDTRVVIFSERIDTLGWLRDQLKTRLRLSDKQVGVLHAQLPDRDLQQLVEDFALESSSLRVLLASDMASEGLNLHRQCHQLIHYDLPWSFIRIQQRNGRIDRYLQLHEPQITALALTSDDPEVPSDLRVVTRLLEKEYAANAALGDAGVLLDLHDEELEEQTVLKHLQAGDDLDDFVPEPTPAQLNPFAVAMTSGGTHEQDPPPELVRMRTLFDDDDNLLAEALTELIDGDPRAAREFDIHRAAEDDLVAFNTPPDLVARLRDLPTDYLRERRVVERIRVTGSKRYAERRLAEARRSEHTTWPDVHFLAPLHPVLEWTIDRVLSRVGRNEALVMAGEVEAPVFLTQALWSNALGQPVVGCWGAVGGLTHGSPTVGDMIATLEEAGIREDAVNPEGLEQLIPDLQPLVPAAIEAALADLRERGRATEEELLARLEDQRRRVKEWAQEALDIVVEAAPSARGKHRRQQIAHDVDELSAVIDSLSPHGEPFVRVVGVIVPSSDHRER